MFDVYKEYVKQYERAEAAEQRAVAGERVHWASAWTGLAMRDMCPVYAFLTICGWHGTTSTRVVIVGRTSKRVRIRAITRTKLAGRNRWLEPGEEALVPNTAVAVQATSELPEPNHWTNKAALSSPQPSGRE